MQLVSKIGEDHYGRILKNILATWGVGTDYLIPDQDIQTPYSMIVAGKTDGSRTLFNFPGRAYPRLSERSFHD